MDLLRDYPWAAQKKFWCPFLKCTALLVAEDKCYAFSSIPSNMPSFSSRFFTFYAVHCISMCFGGYHA